METVRFECEVVTPMFLGGADQKAELRPPSIRGAMRWWFRAMMGGANIKSLSTSESEVFGSTEKGSSFSIVIDSRQSLDVQTDLSYFYKIYWDYNRTMRRVVPPNGKTDGSGIAYLLFAALKRDFIPDKVAFSVRMRLNEIKHVKAVLHSFWLLTTLGAVGLRSRRGAGNLRLKNEPDMSPSLKTSLKNDPPQFVFGGSKPSELKQHLDSILSGITNRSSARSYSALSGSSIYILDKSFPSWIAAMNEIGNKYEAYRFSVRGNVFDGPNFGFPVQHSGPPKTRMIGQSGGAKPIERRSSPLIFKIWTNKTRSEFFAGVIHLSKATLTPTDKILQQTWTRDPMTGKWEWKNGPVNPANSGIVSGFISTLGTCQTVTIL